MAKNYKSDICESIHEEAVALHEVGAISDEQMRHFDNSCLVPEEPPIDTSRVAVTYARRTQRPLRAYADAIKH
jgi:DNA-binding transcriptional regulator YiaG